MRNIFPRSLIAVLLTAGGIAFTAMAASTAFTPFLNRHASKVESRFKAELAAAVVFFAIAAVFMAVGFFERRNRFALDSPPGRAPLDMADAAMSRVLRLSMGAAALLAVGGIASESLAPLASRHLLLAAAFFAVSACVARALGAAKALGAAAGAGGGGEEGAKTIRPYAVGTLVGAAVIALGGVLFILLTHDGSGTDMHVFFPLAFFLAVLFTLAIFLLAAAGFCGDIVRNVAALLRGRGGNGF